MVVSASLIVIVNIFLLFKHPSDARFMNFRSLSRSCKVAAGVFSKASNTVQRDVVRQTWGKTAVGINGVYLLFVVSQGIVLSPHDTIQFERERKNENDILLVDALESAEESFSKSIAWFSWVADKTECEFAFKTEDDSYVRFPALMTFISSKFGTENRRKIYFGMQSESSNSSAPYMLRIGYGLSREVAIWLSKRRERTAQLSAQPDDIALGILLGNLRETIGLDYITDSRAFGENCSAESVLDSPVLSVGFNMYIRFRDDQAGRFCDHVHRSPAISSVYIRQSSESTFSYEEMLRSNMTATDDTLAPWNRRNRRQYADIQDYSHAFSIFSSKNWYPWLALTDVAVYGGEAVVQKMDSIENAIRNLVLERAVRVLHSIFPFCPSHYVVGVWLKTWGSRKEYVANLLCTGRPSSDQALVHVPFHSNGDMDHHSPAYVVGKSRLVVITPISCRLETLKRYLMTSGLELGKVPGRTKRIMLAWSFCHDAEFNFTKSALLDLVGEFRKKEPTVWVELVFFQGGERFSRSKALNAAILACKGDDLLAVVDVDLSVKTDFFLNVLAFTRRRHTMYFPIMFSRFNPDLIALYAEVLHRNTGKASWLSKMGTITAETGLWRDFSFGMVGMFATDARQVGLYDTEINGWGQEDISFFEKCQEHGYMNWRPYDLNEIHLYHPKSCEDMRGRDSYEKCLGSKLRLEGSQLQMAVALYQSNQKLHPKTDTPSKAGAVDGNLKKQKSSKKKNHKHTDAK